MHRNILKEEDLTRYLLSVLKPSRYAAHIPDDQLTPSILKADSATISITIPQPFGGAVPRIVIEFYPNSSQQVFGAVYISNNAAAGMKWLMNLTRTNDLGKSFNWTRAVSKVIKLIVGSRAGGKFDISGQISAITSYANVEEFTDRLTAQLLPGVVNDQNLKVKTDVMEGVVLLGLPTEFDQPFKRLNDTTIIDVSPTPTTTLIDSTANKVDYSRSNAVRYLKQFTYVVPAAAGNTIILNERFRVSGLTPPKVSGFVITNCTDATGRVTTASISTEDLFDTVIHAATISKQSAQSAGEVYQALTGSLPITKDILATQRRPFHYIRFQLATNWYGGPSSTMTVTVNMEIELPGGSNAGEQYPVTICVVENMEVDTKFDIQIDTLDESIPNQALQADVSASTTQVSWAQKKLVELAVADPESSGVKPVMTTSEYEDLVATVEELDYDDHDVEAVMHASNFRHLKKFFRKTLRLARSADKLAPFADALVPGSGQVFRTINEVADAVPFKASSAGGLLRRGYFNAADVEKPPSYSKKVVITEVPGEYVDLNTSDVEGFELFPAVRERKTDIQGALFAAIKFDGIWKAPTFLRRPMKTDFGGRIFGFKDSTGSLSVPIKGTIYLLPVRKKDGKWQINVSTSPEVRGLSYTLAATIADRNNRVELNNSVAYSGIVAKNKKEVLKEIGYVDAKSEVAKHYGLRLVHSGVYSPFGSLKVRTVSQALEAGSHSPDPNTSAVGPMETVDEDLIWYASGGLRKSDRFKRKPKEETEIAPDAVDYDKYFKELTTKLQEVIDNFLGKISKTVNDVVLPLETSPTAELCVNKIAFLNETLAITSQILEAHSDLESLEVTTQDFGSGLVTYAEDGAFPVQTKSDYDSTVSKDSMIYNFVNKFYYEGKHKDYSKLSKSEKAKWRQYGAPISSYSLTALDDNFPISSNMVKAYYAGDDTGWHNLSYKGAVYRTVREWVNNGADLDRFEEYENVFLSEHPGYMPTSEQSRKLSGSKKTPAPKFKERSNADLITTAGFKELIDNAALNAIVEKFKKEADDGIDFRTYLAMISKYKEFKDLAEKAKNEDRQKKILASMGGKSATTTTPKPKKTETIQRASLGRILKAQAASSMTGAPEGTLS